MLTFNAILKQICKLDVFFTICDRFFAKNNVWNVLQKKITIIEILAVNTNNWLEHLRNELSRYFDKHAVSNLLLLCDISCQFCNEYLWLLRVKIYQLVQIAVKVQKLQFPLKTNPYQSPCMTVIFQIHRVLSML